MFLFKFFQALTKYGTLLRYNGYLLLSFQNPELSTLKKLDPTFVYYFTFLSFNTYFSFSETKNEIEIISLAHPSFFEFLFQETFSGLKKKKLLVCTETFKNSKNIRLDLRFFSGYNLGHRAYAYYLGIRPGKWAVAKDFVETLVLCENYAKGDLFLEWEKNKPDRWGLIIKKN